MSKEKKALLLLWTYLILIFTPKSKSNNDTKNVIYNEDYIDERCFPTSVDTNENIHSRIQPHCCLVLE